MDSEGGGLLLESSMPDSGARIHFGVTVVNTSIVQFPTFNQKSDSLNLKKIPPNQTDGTRSSSFSSFSDFRLVGVLLVRRHIQYLRLL